MYNAYDDLKIALCICPQWSIATPSFALGSLNTALTEAGFNPTQYDINIMSSMYLRKNRIGYFTKWTQDDPWTTKKLFWDEILPFFKEYWFEIIHEISNYDVVSFTTYTSNIMVTDYLARYLRQINPKIHIWYGGPFCWYGENGGLVEKNKYREFVDVGCGTNEGEKTIVELATDLLEHGNYENTKGVWRWDKLRPSFATVLNRGRSGRKPVYNGDPQITNLNDLNSPTWNDTILSGYKKIRSDEGLNSDFGPNLIVPIQGSRGCTFKCTFCSETRLYRYRSPEKLIDDIRDLNIKYGVKNFWFTDSLINGSISLFENFIDILNKNIDEKKIPKIKWGGYFRTHKKMNKKFMKKARKSGLSYMNIGVENGVPKTLALMEKNQTPDIIKNFLDAVTEHNQIVFDAGWIPGYPKETTIDFLNSLKFLYDVKDYFKYDGRSGRINLMKGTDVLVDTPLDLYRDVFDISKNESLLKNWISNDYKNNIFSRDLRSHLTDLFLNIFKINQRGRISSMEKLENKIESKAQSWALDTSSFCFKDDGNKLKISNNSIFGSSFLLPKDKEYKFETILINSLVDNIKGFVWLLHNLKKNIFLEFDINDNLQVYNLKDIIFFTHVYFKTKSNSDFVLKINLKIKIHEEDRKYLNVKGVDDLKLDESFEIKGNFDKDYSKNNKVVSDIYFDSMNVDKYKINLKRTALTGGY